MVRRDESSRVEGSMAILNQGAGVHDQRVCFSLSACFAARAAHRFVTPSCTSEGLKAVIFLQSLPNMPQLVSRERMCDAIDIILSLQNADGGFAACELVRGSKLLEMLNPAEVFRDIMIEYTYPECTTACE